MGGTSVFDGSIACPEQNARFRSPSPIPPGYDPGIKLSQKASTVTTIIALGLLFTAFTAQDAPVRAVVMGVIVVGFAFGIGRAIH